MFADPSLDTILRVAEIFSILGGGGLVAFKVGRSTEAMDAAVAAQEKTAQALKSEIDGLKEEVKQVGKILTQLALQEQRLNMLDKRYEELRHGEGFVFPLIRAPAP